MSISTLVCHVARTIIREIREIRNAVCHRCKKRGHIASVCKSEIHSLDVGDEDELVSTHTIHCHHTIEDDEDSNFVHLDVTLNNVTVKAELSTYL